MWQGCITDLPLSPRFISHPPRPGAAWDGTVLPCYLEHRSTDASDFVKLKSIRHRISSDHIFPQLQALTLSNWGQIEIGTFPDELLLPTHRLLSGTDAPYCLDDEILRLCSARNIQLEFHGKCSLTRHKQIDDIRALLNCRVLYLSLTEEQEDLIEIIASLPQLKEFNARLNQFTGILPSEPFGRLWTA
jgi:hypothetical protein